MHDINKTAVLELIRTKSPVSRTYIARALGLSLTSVVRIIDELIKQNFITTTGETEFSGGRRRPLVRINLEGSLCISIDLGGTKLYAALMNLCGDVLHEKSIVNHGLTGEEVYTAMREIIAELVAFAQNTGKTLLGISVGVPSYIDESGSVALHAPSLNWRNFPLLERLKRDFDMAAVIENDLNLAALGETWFGEGRNTSDFAFISVGTGLAAGIVMGHSVYTGAHNMAGEIGYTAFGKEFLRKEYPGFGPLESMAAGSGIAQQAADWFAAGGDGRKPESLSAADVFASCREGEPWARQIADNFADYLTMAIISVCSVIDPAAVILGGGVMKSSDLFIDRVRDNMRFSYFKDIPVKISSLDKNATVLGATIRLYHKLCNFCAIRSWA